VLVEGVEVEVEDRGLVARDDGRAGRELALLAVGHDRERAAAALRMVCRARRAANGVTWSATAKNLVFPLMYCCSPVTVASRKPL
jgi:hypothetical protein